MDSLQPGTGAAVAGSATRRSLTPNPEPGAIAGSAFKTRPYPTRRNVGKAVPVEEPLNLRGSYGETSTQINADTHGPQGRGEPQAGGLGVPGPYNPAAQPASHQGAVRMNDLDPFGEPAPAPGLAELAAAINADHAAAERTARKALEHARAAGDKLLLAKAQVEHGQWLPWLSTHCPDLAVRTAQAYMRLAGNWGTLEAKYATVAYLPINDALKLLNAPEPEPISGDLLIADDPATPGAYHDRIDPQRLPATPAPAVSAASITAMLAALPEPDRRAVLDNAAAAGDLKVVRADAKYLHVSQARHEWYTPVEYIAAARDVMGGIDLDPASCEVAQATVQARQFFSKEQDGLAQPWQGRVWLNPPFEAAVIAPFVAKLIADYQAGAVQQAVILTDAATDTRWFHDLADMALCFCFTKGRIKFTSPLSDSQAPQRGQLFTYLGRDTKGFDRFKQRFADIGLVVVAVQ